ncbi:MAG: hypothetical protein SWZ49_24915 [Cyanobacteriota bacterium]|nr:hypothetical protein [Cyanobacteriota bacterium]
MKRQHLRFLNQFRLKIPVTINVLIASSLLLLASSGCSNKSQNEVQLEIQSIQREDSRGSYKVVGSTNLPESSRIAITAVRYLRPTTANAEQIIGNNDGNVNRSILARQIVEVKQGKWEADLNLWEVAPNGNFQEVWQTNKNYKTLTPEREVGFIATFNPVGQLPSSDKEDAQQPIFQQLEGKSLRFTNEGEKYVQASQFRSVSLPVGKTTPVRVPEEFNNGWGNRYQLKAQSENSASSLPTLGKSQQTNAPLSNSQFLR